jgi:hypothetical protein
VNAPPNPFQLAAEAAGKAAALEVIHVTNELTAEAITNVEKRLDRIEENITKVLGAMRGCITWLVLGVVGTALGTLVIRGAMSFLAS